jgi:DNA-binding response OmpR family regulator
MLDVEDGQKTVVGPFVILKERGQVFFDDPGTRAVTEISLSKTPRRLFCYLLEAGRSVTRGEILVDVLSDRADHVGNVIDVHINNIRRELERVTGNDRWIVTIRRVGYKFDPNPPPEA